MAGGGGAGLSCRVHWHKLAAAKLLRARPTQQGSWTVPSDLFPG